MLLDPTNPAHASEKEGAMLRAYMVFSREGGSQEVAILVFAHNGQEARKVAWKESEIRDITDDMWTDVGVRQLRGDFFFRDADPEKLARGEPHCNLFSTGCKACELWGSPINSEGYCPECEAEREAQQKEEP